MKSIQKITGFIIALFFLGAVPAYADIEFSVGDSQEEVTGLYSLYSPTFPNPNTMILGGWASRDDPRNYLNWQNEYILWLEQIASGDPEPIGEPGPVWNGDFNRPWPYQREDFFYIFEFGPPPADVVGADKIFKINKSGTWNNNTSLVLERVGEHINDPDVVDTGSRMYMFYTSLGNAAIAQSTFLGNLLYAFPWHEVGVAYSDNDGATWTDRGILINAWESGDGEGAWAPSAVLVGDEIWVYYHTGTTDFSDTIVYRERFNKNTLAKIGSPQQLVFPDSAGLLANVDVAKVGSNYILAGNLLGRATLDTITLYSSEDGLTFNDLPDADDGTNIFVQKNSGVAVTPEIVPNSPNSARIYYGESTATTALFETIRSAPVTFGTVTPPEPSGSCTPRSLSEPKNVSGYAWSSTIGWVSMSCENDGSCGTSDYGLSVSSSGDIDGYAWSENIGWISFFEEDLANCPSGSCSASLDQTTGEVTGWARAVAPLCGAYADQSGNWDGWIYLGQSNRVGVSANNCSWEGNAWGGDESLDIATIGWLSFKGPGYGVNGSGDACVGDGGDADLTAGNVVVNTQNNDSRAIFTIPIENIGNSGVSGGIDVRIQIAYDSDHSSEFDENYDANDAITNLNAGQTKDGSYTLDNPRSGRHQVRACVDHNNEIAESNENNNCGPVTTFQIDNGGNGGGLSVQCSPNTTEPDVGETVTWTATVQGNVGVTTYEWTGTDSLSGTTNPITKAYGTTGTKTASVTVEAENATVTESCSAEVNVGGGGTNDPTATLTADPDEVLFGNSTTLEWSSERSNSCTGTGFNTGGATSGSVTVTPANDASYQLRCVRGNREAITFEDVDVLFPDITITADGTEGQTRVGLNDVVEISWTAEDVEECNISGPGINLQNQTGDPVEGNQNVTIGQRSTYTLECFVQGSPFTESVVVNIPPDFEEF